MMRLLVFVSCLFGLASGLNNATLYAIQNWEVCRVPGFHDCAELSTSWRLVKVILKQYHIL